MFTPARAHTHTHRVALEIAPSLGKCQRGARAVYSALSNLALRCQHRVILSSNCIANTQLFVANTQLFYPRIAMRWF